MARYRGILRAAVALVLLFPAAWRADAQDMLIVDSGGARWKSGASREPPVSVDFGVLDALSAAGRPSAARRQDRRPRRYLTLNIPQPEAPLAALPPVRPPQPPARPAAGPEPGAAPAGEAELAAVLAAEPQPAPVGEPELPAIPAAGPGPADPSSSQPPAMPSGPVLSKLPAPAVSAPSARSAALSARRLPVGKTEATPALRAFLNRAAATRAANAGGAPLRRTAPAEAAGAALPPPRPIQPRPAETNAAAPPPARSEPRFRLPPPAPATGGPAKASPSSAAAGASPPLPPATGVSGTGVLPPPSASGAGASAPPRRRLALDATLGPVAAAPSGPETQSETFFYKAGATGLGAEDRARLDGLAAKLAGGAALRIEVRAYAGSAEGGGAEARREAWSRAMEVRRLLIAAGVPDTRIVAQATDVGEEPAGRVDIVLVGRS